ncbi:hypothetical protein HNV11_08305 [Spirosoma taeanense]|uniref:Gingipain domain-containing protein n=1 Tax=Spirosoma taeanense TaxID=2735870 RepID=A0A6M5Y7K0_9BACT|nr:C25 family cysteine peptidase [Spirosoma taeanense]QJW89386.1 hypothetical protein HNV11_08305 [Spirosoma taeanense]
MPKLCTCIFLLTFSLSASWAQNLPLGNEWINYQQTYYKIPVMQPGLYRITTAELQRAGVPVGQVNPTTLQLFHRGVEQAIYVEGETDSRFDAPDFVEFYGRGNDGSQDSLLYQPYSAMPHAYYSLFSDTTAYFLTWRPDGRPGRRITAYSDTDFSGLTPEPYHWEEELRVFTQTYPAGTIYPIGAGYSNGAILTGYDVGEGWTGPVVRTNTRYDQSFSLTGFVAGAGVNPQISYLLVGRNPRAHRVEYLAGPAATSLRTLGTQLFQDYNTTFFKTELTPNDLTKSGSVLVSLLPREEEDEVSASYLKLRYPQRLDMGGAARKWLHLRLNPGGRSSLELLNVPAGSRLFDITHSGDLRRIDGQLSGGRWRGVVRDSQTERTLLMTSQPLSVLSIKPVAFRSFASQTANYVIITHPILRQPVSGVADPIRAYAAYRASEAGGHYDTLTVNIDQLFDQFSYGERHPLGIRRFADYMLRNSNRPKFLFLVGQSRDPQGIRKNPNGLLLDLVPNAGWPGSDLGLVEGLNGEVANVPAMPIGRLNATRSQTVLDYLSKVKEHENTSEPALWRKNILHLSGGNTESEIQTFRQFVDEFKDVVEARYVGGRVTTLSKQTDNPVESFSVVDLVNRGFGMISMFGHSSLDVSDIDVGFASDDRMGYRNQGRYPFMLANGCAAGNFYFGLPTFGSDWITTPNRGAVLFMAHTYNGFGHTLKSYSDQLYALLTDSNYVAKPLAYLQQETIRRYLQTHTSVYEVTTAQQMTLQGDPAVSVFPFPKADFAVAPGSLRLSGNRGGSLAASDSVVVSGVLINYGRVSNNPLTVRFRRYEASGLLIREERFTQPAPFYTDTLQWKLPNDPTESGTTYFELLLDPDDRITETSETNNKAEISTAGQVSSLPFPADLTPPIVEVAFDGQRISDGDVVSARPVIDVLVQDDNRRLLRADTTEVELYLQRPCTNGPCPYERLSLRGNGVQWTAAGSDNAFRLSYQPSTPLPDGRYGFEAISADLSGNRGAPYQIHFTVRNQPELTAVSVYPNPFGQQTRFSIILTGLTPPADLTVLISDLTGRVVRTLHRPARIGLNEWFWDGTSDAGTALAGGVYLYSIEGADLPVANTISLKGRLILTR